MSFSSRVAVSMSKNRCFNLPESVLWKDRVPNGGDPVDKRILRNPPAMQTLPLSHRHQWYQWSGEEGNKKWKLHLPQSKKESTKQHQKGYENIPKSQSFNHPSIFQSIHSSIDSCMVDVPVGPHVRQGTRSSDLNQRNRFFTNKSLGGVFFLKGFLNFTWIVCFIIDQAEEDEIWVKSWKHCLKMGLPIGTL